MYMDSGEYLLVPESVSSGKRALHIGSRNVINEVCFLILKCSNPIMVDAQI
jgi:hypothetical protein